jgi:hypothetical protein
MFIIEKLLVEKFNILRVKSMEFNTSEIAKWDKDDLDDFEAKVLKLELAKNI